MDKKYKKQLQKRKEGLLKDIKVHEENLKTFLAFWKEYKSAYEEFKLHG